MGIRSWLSRQFAGPTASGRRVRGSYDSAQTTAENADHWKWADSLNANAANSPEVRRVLRERARYEAENNGYAGGLVDKLGADLIGTGPRVQIRIPGADRSISRAIEAAFRRWAQAVGLGAKLRLLDNMAVRDGEGFALLTHNPRLDPAGVQLDVRLYEADQVESPYWNFADERAFSGGRIDEWGNVVEWDFLRTHPGSDVWGASFLDADVIDARNVVHWYKPRRAGQLRGVPEILSSLTLYAYLRRYTLATVAAAETAANLAGVLETELPADREDGAPDIKTMEDIPLVRGSLLTMPAGWKASQFKPEQPVNTYKDFKGEVLTEAGQPVGAPRNISTGSSAEYNYSSGRLDHGIYQRGVKVRRGDLRDRVLDRVFGAWLDEASLIPGLIPAGLPLRAAWTWDWYFDGFASLDPSKDAQTDKVRLETGTTTYAEIFAEKGLDWEEQFEQRAREIQRLAELNIPVARVKARRVRRRKAVPGA